MIMNIIILAVLLFLVYLNKDKIITLFKKDEVNKPFTNKTYDLRTTIDSSTGEINGHFLNANFNVTTTNLSRKDEVIKNIRFYANRVKKDNYAFNDEHELIIINEKEIEKMEIAVPQSRTALQKFDNDFKIYVNEELTFNFTLPCKSMSLLLSNMSINTLSLGSWLYFISAEVEMVDGTVSHSNRILLSHIVGDITRIANFDLEGIYNLMSAVDKNDAEERARHLRVREYGEVRMNEGLRVGEGGLDEFLTRLNNVPQINDTVEVPPHIAEILGLNEVDNTNDDDND